MKIYVTKAFQRFCRKEAISDADLRHAVQSMESGLIDASLGKMLFKQRIARKGSGKRSGYRAILMFRHKHRVVFLYGFPKNAKATLTPLELTTYQQLAKLFDGADNTQLTAWCTSGDAQEIEDDAS